MSELTFSQIKPLLFADLRVGKVGLTPALLGEPGIGKSSLVEDLAKEFKTKVFTLPVNQLADRSDLTGVRMTQDADDNWGQTFFPHMTIMESIAYATANPDENPILFLDEFNRASSDITSAILSFQTLRRIGSIEFPDNLRLIVAGNDKGNVTALDKASVTRFSVYRVKPDIDTFMSVQTLNPYVEAVLNKHPEDLLAPMVESAPESSGDPDADDDSNSYDLSSEFDSEDGFEQATVPRTITATSGWLDTMGINKTASPEEMKTLHALVSQTSVDDLSDTLKIGLVAHSGDTLFTLHLYDEIKEFYFQNINGTAKTAKAVLTMFRPSQDVINQLSKAQDTMSTSAIVQGLNDKEKGDLLIWLFESVNGKEINNNAAISHAIKETSNSIMALDSNHMKGLNTILANTSLANEEAITTFITSGSQLADTYKVFISATLGLDI